MIEFRRDGYGTRITDDAGGTVHLTALDAQVLVDSLWENYYQGTGPASVEWPYPYPTENEGTEKE